MNSLWLSAIALLRSRGSMSAVPGRSPNLRDAGNVSPSRMPSMPAAIISENAMYGLSAESGERSSMRARSPVAWGRRTTCELSSDQPTLPGMSMSDSLS